MNYLADVTPRQRELINLLMDGWTSEREVAEQMGIGVTTVKSYIRNIQGRWHIDSGPFIVKNRIVYLEAVRRGLIGKTK